MITTRLFRSFAAIAGVFLIASCSDSSAIAPTDPTATDNGSNLLSGWTGAVADPAGLELRAVPWTQERESEITVSRTIDAAGGLISIPGTGLTVVFPPGAVNAPVGISITADKKYVAYTMQPAGTQFLKDVVVTQALSPTALFGQPLGGLLYAAYVADNGDLSGVLSVLELEPSRTLFSPFSPLLPVAQVWLIRHFSKYILASG